MSESAEFQVGDEVIASSGARGTVCDARTMSNGDAVYGVSDTTGAVRFYTADGIKRVL